PTSGTSRPTTSRARPTRADAAPARTPGGPRPWPRTASLPQAHGRGPYACAGHSHRPQPGSPTPLIRARYVPCLMDGNGNDPRSDAAAAGLRYVADDEPGLTRRVRGRGFTFLDAGGRPVDDPGTVSRLRALAVPPAWRDVWLCPDADGHLQATGRDEAGRKQYVYHPAFTAVRLLDCALIRVGNATYAKANGSYGVTTLRDRHVRVDGDAIDLRFVGKSGERHARSLVDEELAVVIRDCQELPGYELFRYRDAEGSVETIDSRDVNDY